MVTVPAITPGQKAAIAVEFLPALAKEAKQRQGEYLRSADRDESGRAKSGSPEPNLGTTGGHRARNDAGALVGVSESGFLVRGGPRTQGLRKLSIPQP